jgi:hypothetical protein
MNEAPPLYKAFRMTAEKVVETLKNRFGTMVAG